MGQSDKKKTTLAERGKEKLDGAMAARGASIHTRRLVFHYVTLLWQQLVAMLPITMLQVLVLAIFFQKTTPTPALEAAGLISAVLGLVLFLDGLRVAIMPMAMQVGTDLPMKLKLPWVLLVAFCLGVLVTYAEPAIAAIRPLAALVDPGSAPYLYYMMNQQQEIMVLAIGMGVGVAAVVGTLKFLYNISLKLLIAAALLPTVGCACYMQWGNRHLQPLMGVAWDCGAVTTGPVTVPVLLSLGVGVMGAQKQKKLALAVLEDAALKKNEGNTLEGFGIVTLASLLPILAVEIMAIITSIVHPYEYVLQQAHLAAAAAASVELPQAERSPVKEVVYGIRAISPLIVALVLLVVVVLRQPLPNKGFLVDEEDEEYEQTDNCGGSSRSGSAFEGSSTGGGSKGSRTAAAAVVKQGVDVEEGCGRQDSDPESDVQCKQIPAGNSDAGVGAAAAMAAAAPAAAAAGPQPSSKSRTGRQRVGREPSLAGRTPSVAQAVVLTAGASDAEYFDITLPCDASSIAETAASSSGDSTKMAGCMACLSKYSSLIAAMLMCQVGMILFNLGLTYGFAALGDMTGITLPAAFLTVPYEPHSPYYSFAGGVTLTMATIFMLGIFATKAEPALNVLGETVETLSGGKFTKRLLIWAVCFGVAIGMCAGACKILFQLPLIYFILVKYAAACSLTAIARESITAVAWDSAGVTTGPVTVPFVLAIGIGFSKAVGAPEGFGMLTVMSVAPIISVLLTSLMKQPVKKAATELARMSKMSIQKVSRSLQTTSAHGDIVDFAAQLRANPALMAQAKLTGKQLENVDRPAPMQRIGEHSMIVPPHAARSQAP